MMIAAWNITFVFMRLASSLGMMAKWLLILMAVRHLPLCGAVVWRLRLAKAHIGMVYTPEELRARRSEVVVVHTDRFGRELSMWSYPDVRNFNNSWLWVRWDDLNEELQAVYSEMLPAFEEFGEIHILRPIGNATLESIWRPWEIMGVTLEELEKIAREMGYFYNPFFVIPVAFELRGASLAIGVDTSQVYVNEGNAIKSISIILNERG
jgi:hypothetical protein